MSNPKVVEEQKETTQKQPVEATPKNLRYMRDKERELVKGIFRYYEVPGGSFSFVFKKYKGDPVERYDFIDGNVYTIPLAVARHLNKNTSYPVYEYLPGEEGAVRTGGLTSGRTVEKNLHGMRIGKRVQRCGFQSLEFLDVDGLEEKPQIFTVEKTF